MRTIFLAVALILPWTQLSAWAQFPLQPGITLRALNDRGQFKDSSAPEALRFACSVEPAQLRHFFKNQGLRFDMELLVGSENEVCHIYYEPTIRGFRADPDNLPVEQLYFSVNTLNFLSQRPGEFGEALHVLKQLSERSPRLPKINLLVRFSIDEAMLNQASVFHFKQHAGNINLVDTGSDLDFPWLQDCMKSGVSDGVRRILVPRNVFENDPEFGSQYGSFLDSFSGPAFARSKLSWEGGDIQLINDPRDSRRVLLIHGTGAKPYWGSQLTPKEYSYVLAAEFGADDTVLVPDLPSHVDFYLSFFPEDRIALVSTPVKENQDLARAAAQLLHEQYPEAIELHKLVGLLEGSAEEFRRHRKSIREAIQEVSESEARWSKIGNLIAESEVSRDLDLLCQGHPAECLSLEGQRRLVTGHNQLLQRWISASLKDQQDDRLPRALLAIIEGQLEGSKVPWAGEIERLAGRLGKLGFRVIRIPQFGGESPDRRPWGGVTYVNGLLLDNTFFVPRFGLGAVEDRIIEDFQNLLPPPYQVQPIHSRFNLLFNGGIHCTTGIIRGPARSEVLDP